MNDDDIRKIFFAESEEALIAAEDGLLACQQGTHDGETINAIFRAVHSVKGGAGAFGYIPTQGFTHVFENLLGDVREGKIELSGELVELMLGALDILRDHIDHAQGRRDQPDDAAMLEQLEAARGGGDKDDASGDPAGGGSNGGGDDDLDALLAELDGGGDASSADQTPEPESSDTGLIVHIRPHAGAMDNGGEPLLLLRELSLLGGECTACHTDDIPELGTLEPDAGYFAWTFRMPDGVAEEAVREIFEFVDDDCDIAVGENADIPPARVESTPGAPEPTPKSDRPEEDAAADDKAKEAKPDGDAAKSPAPRQVQVSQSVRVDLAKLDKLINGVGELVIAQSMLSQRLADENFPHVEELTMLDTLVRDIQERAMAFRAQPIGSVFGRVPRLLRELAGTTGKKVELEVIGETTELDKTVIERLSEPLTHLIRNAVDHGIESPEKREAAGKPAEGRLVLKAEQTAGRVLITIRDDGGGIDREKVFAKAVANKLISEDANLTDEEIDELVFAPGFSTAAEVSNISGRGVGMDVVKQNVKDLGGRIAIESTPGSGTSFILALPLTMAIADGMIVQVGDQTLVIPLSHVIESTRPQPGELSGIGQEGRMLNVRGQFVPVVSLGQMLDAREYQRDPCSGVLVLVECEGQGRAALLVDAITDQRQFVIKNLDNHYRAVEGVAGATILGNGRVALIVDIDHLVQNAAQKAAMAEAA
ncbi:chemotaxis protein CheA [Erythrobacter sp.]|uniref:chemotaxis protein CheA n=1 Tax=Erythrobacter sp. TaxID=1042 RepID=UPI002EC76F83|nr:chemotaxis protein CheA [Erythrobacter sp.]